MAALQAPGSAAGQTGHHQTGALPDYFGLGRGEMIARSRMAPGSPWWLRVRAQLEAAGAVLSDSLRGPRVSPGGSSPARGEALPRKTSPDLVMPAARPGADVALDLLLRLPKSTLDHGFRAAPFEAAGGRLVLDRWAQPRRPLDAVVPARCGQCLWGKWSAQFMYAAPRGARQLAALAAEGCLISRNLIVNTTFELAPGFKGAAGSEGGPPP